MQKTAAQHAVVRKAIHTDRAPDAIGVYSQAIQCGDTLYISGQLPLEPSRMELVDESFEAAAHQAFRNLDSVARAAGGDINDAVKVNISLTDLANFATVNKVMAQYFSEPYPARAAVGVAALPKGAPIEIEAIVLLRDARAASSP
ncbi:MAG: RidA family protein [bacterium]